MARKDRRRKQVPTVMSFNWDSTPGPQALRPELPHFPASTGGARPVDASSGGRPQGLVIADADSLLSTEGQANLGKEVLPHRLQSLQPSLYDKWQCGTQGKSVIFGNVVN